MYLKKIDGPRAVKLPDGSMMTRADLPPQKTRRWVASRKAVVVKAVEAGLITMKEAMERYALERGGVRGLAPRGPRSRRRCAEGHGATKI
jgi:hypothetical protein